MRALTILLAACACAAGEDCRTYDVRPLTGPRRDELAPPIGFSPGSEGVFVTEPAQIEPVQLAELLTAAVGPETWDGAGNSVEFSGGLLHVRTNPENHAAIAAVLEYLHARSARTVVLDAEFLEVPREAFEAVGAAPGALDAPQAAALRAAARAQGGREIARLSARGTSGAFSQTSALRRRSYVADFVIEIAQHVTVPDPVIADHLEGATLEFLPYLSDTRETISLEITLRTARLAEMAEFALPPGSGGRVELPRTDAFEVRTRISAAPGTTLLLWSGHLRSGVPGTVAAVLATPRIEGGRPAEPPAGENGDSFRAWNVGALLRLPWKGFNPPLPGLREIDKGPAPGD
jgi:hypothetical protein